MDLVFMGSGAFGVPTLRSLASKHRIRGIVTQPDRPAGRGTQLTPTPIAEFAASELAGIPILKPEKVNSPDVVSTVRAFNCPTYVVIAFGQKIGKALLDGVFSINLHASLLPRWRGAAPINAAILAGDRTTGNSVITLADKMDAGLILGQSRRDIDPLITAGELHDLLSADGPALVEDVLSRHASNALAPITQDESLVTIAPKMAKTDGWIDFAQGAEACRCRVHGLTPWPGVTVQLHPSGPDSPAEQMKLIRVQPVDRRSEQPPGRLIDAADGIIACAGDRSLRLIDVQPAGKRAMKWPDYARGRRIAPEAVFIGGRPQC